MPRRKSALTTVIDESSESIEPELIFKRISSGFFWDIRADLVSGLPFLHLNLTAVECIQYLPVDDNPAAGRRVIMTSGKTYDLVSRNSVIDLMCGLEALKKFLKSGRF